jgi:predicted acetyltransferase
MIQLVKPSVKYKESFLNAINEPDSQKLFKRFELEEDFGKYVEKINSYINGAPLENGFVPESTFWIVENEEYIGRVSIRHKLTKQLEASGGHIGIDIKPSKRGMGFGKKALSLGLQKARKIGLNQVLLTCRINNVPSRRMIEACGGKLKEIENDVCRYWIFLK